MAHSNERSSKIVFINEAVPLKSCRQSLKTHDTQAPFCLFFGLLGYNTKIAILWGMGESTFGGGIKIWCWWEPTVG